MRRAPTDRQLVSGLDYGTRGPLGPSPAPTTTRQRIAHRARLVVARELIVNPHRIVESSEFRADLEADSLDMAQLWRAIEAEFGIRISDDEAAFCQTVGTAIDLIETKLENRRAQ